LEAAEQVCGDNIYGVHTLVECRDGASERYDREKRPHVLTVPAEINWIKIQATKLTKYIQKQWVRKAYLPLLERLANGETVLVYCLNGAHRSVQTVTNAVNGSLGNPSLAMNWVWMRRHLADFRGLPGCSIMFPTRLALHPRKLYSAYVFKKKWVWVL
jgi:hypothetical protein